MIGSVNMFGELGVLIRSLGLGCVEGAQSGDGFSCRWLPS